MGHLFDHSPPALAAAAIICKQRKVAATRFNCYAHWQCALCADSGTSLPILLFTPEVAQNICKAVFTSPPPLFLSDPLTIPFSQFLLPIGQHDGIVMLATFNSPSREAPKQPIIQNVQLFSNEGFAMWKLSLACRRESWAAVARLSTVRRWMWSLSGWWNHFGQL